MTAPPTIANMPSAPLLEIRRPMMSVASVALICNCSTKAVENHILDGKIPYALDDDALALGAHIRQQTEHHAAEKNAERREVARMVRQADAGGFALTGPIRHPEMRRRGMELLQESAAEIARQEEPHGVGAPRQPVKTFILDTPAAVKPTPVQYWNLWAKIEKARPDLKDQRHAITRKALASAGQANPGVNAMTPEQLAKMISVFSAILEEATAVKL